MSEIKILNKRCDWVYSDDPEDDHTIPWGLVGEMEIEDEGQTKFLFVKYDIESDDFLECGINYLVSDKSNWPNRPEVQFNEELLLKYYDQFQEIMFDIGDLIGAKINVSDEDNYATIMDISTGEIKYDVSFKEFFRIR